MNSHDQSQKNKTKEIIFEELIKFAANQDAQRFEDDFPSEEELQKRYQPSERFEQNMQNMISLHKRKYRMKTVLKMTTRIAACFLLAVALFLTITLSVEATRVQILNFVTEVKEEYTNIRYDDGTNPPTGQSDLFQGWEQVYLPGYVPEGFAITKTERLIKICTVEYTNKEGVNITFSYFPASSSTLSVDSENAVVKEITILGNKALAVQQNKTNVQENKIVFHNNEISFYISSPYSMEELTKMADSVKIIK